MSVSSSPTNASTDAMSSPSARRSKTSSWRDPRLGIGVLIVAVSVLAGSRLFDNADDTVAVWALRSDLDSGSPVGAADLARRDIGFSTPADADRYLSADDAVPSGATLQRAVGAGELLPRGALGNQGTGPVTEVPLAVSADAVPQTVRTGSVVDVWAVPEAAAGARTGGSELVFDDVVVIASSAPGSALAPSGTRQIIIAIEQTSDDELSNALTAAARGAVVVTRQG